MGNPKPTIWQVQGWSEPYTYTVYTYTVYGRILSAFPAKNTVYTQRIYGSGQP